MATIRGPARALCTLGSALLLLTACDKLTNNDSSEWARAALERNGELTVVAFDKKENTFTVRMKDSGELHVVRADQIVGDIPGLASEEGKPKSVSDEPAPVGETTARANPAPPPDQSATTGEVAHPANELDARNPPPATSATSSTSGTAVITDPRTGSVLASNTSTDDTAQAEAAKNTAAGKKVLASGPGYSITAGDHATPPSAIRLASRSAEIPSPARGIALERRYEPMICQGQQMLHIDGRNLEFEGDAVSAEDGCEIHITNSHIIAHGVGISARAANVHIKNSVIEGESGSVSASQGSQVYTQQSTFKGLSRRLDTATFHDLGGTVWN